MSSIAECLQCAKELKAFSDTPQLDVEVLLAFAIKKTRTYLYTWPEKHITGIELLEFDRLFQARKKGEPIAYLTGEQEFWSLPLVTCPSTLIPRPETELLVESVLSLAEKIPTAAKNLLDLGTGTGAIALALASEQPSWSIQGVDVMPEAVNLAKKNATLLKLSTIHFYQSHWFDAIDTKTVFDFIVSNPPYIDANDPHLQEGDVRFEPLSALVANNNGLADLQHIIIGSRAYLAEGGWLLLEHGYQQAPLVRQALTAAGFSEVRSDKDLAGHERISYGQWVG